ncbi:MAG: FAD:protein FMN transferase [Allomuricauda sp.]
MFSKTFSNPNYRYLFAVKKLSALQYVLLTLWLILNCTHTLAQHLQPYSFSKPAMGTQLNITLYATGAQRANEVALAVFERVGQLNAIFSDYDADSEVNRLCTKENFNTWVKVSDELFDILQLSKKVSKSTKGAFDVTMGKYTRLWRQSKRDNKLPSKEELGAGKTFGYDDVLLKVRDRTVKIKNPEILMDFGGIAKGYTAQQILILLKENRIEHALIDFGGDITVSNAPPNRKGWNIEVKYEDTTGEALEILSVDNLSVATSGDLYQKVSIQGETYSHIIDPATGLGITSPIQVTVIATSGALADSYATALSVMGMARAKKFLKRKRNKDVHSLISYVENGTIKVWKSDYFDSFKVADE